MISVAESFVPGNDPQKPRHTTNSHRNLTDDGRYSLEPIVDYLRIDRMASVTLCTWQGTVLQVDRQHVLITDHSRLASDDVNDVGRRQGEYIT